jgi:hypothetical protein
MSDVAMHRALMRYTYYRTIYSCTRPEVVNILHVCTHCVYTVHTLCTLYTLCVHSSAYTHSLLQRNPPNTPN